MGDRSRQDREKPQPNVPRLSRAKKFLFAVVFLSGVWLFAELALWVAGVRPVAVESDPYIGFQSWMPLFVQDRDENGRTVLHTAPNKLSHFNEQSFPATKAPGTYRVFCLGGSTTYGRPYNDRTSFPGWLRLYLHEASPEKKWEVINCGGISYASYRVATLMEELVAYEPDLFIVLTGHNEFLERRTYGDLIDESVFETGWRSLSSRSRVVSAMRSMVRRFSSDSHTDAKKRFLLAGEVTPLLDNAAGLDLYHRDEELRRRILQHFEFNLRRMVSMARAAGAEILFVQPAANVKDFSPFKSEHRDGLSAEDLQVWDALISRGNQALSAHEYEAASRAFAQALEIDPVYADTHFQMGKTLFAAGRYEEASVAFDEALRQDVCPLRVLPEMQSCLARVASQQGVGLIDFPALLKSRCREQYGHTILGSEFFIDHVHPTIDAHRLLALELLDFLSARGIADLRSDWNDEAIDVCTRRVLDSIDEHEHALARGILAKVLRWAGKDDESDRLLESIDNELPNDVELLTLRADAAQRHGRLDEAIALYQRALQINADFVSASIGLGAVYERQGRFEDAVAHYRRLLADHPDHLVVRQRLGVALTDSGETEKAIKEFRTVLQRDPANSEAQISLAKAFMQIGKPEEALEACQRALSVDPRSAVAHTIKGAMLDRLNRTDDAVASYENAVRFDPNLPEAHFNLGLVAFRQKRHKDAARHYRDALRCNPKLADAYLQLSLVHESEREFAEAVSVLEQGLRATAQDSRLQQRLAWIRATCPVDSLRDCEQAMSLSRQACDTTRVKNLRCVDTLAAAYAECGDFEAARRMISRTLSMAAGRAGAEQVAMLERRLALYSEDQPLRIPSE